MYKLKVLFHINELDRWPVALANITNLIKDLGDNAADIVVLANGPSVKAYADEEKVAVMQELSEKGTLFQACRNSLKKLCADGNVCIKEETLPLFVQVVPAGITEIIRRQADGYAYVKP
jgi:intracellular sulfur oxidation DsrE/DsrF family protein